MLSLLEGSEQPPASSFETRQRHPSILDPLSTSLLHDLRNPLSAICAAAEMLTDQQMTPDRAKQLGRNICRAASRMRELLGDLAGVCQGKLPAADNCSLHEVLAAARGHVAVAADTYLVRILCDLPPMIEVVLVRSQMERVFVNLITNALEAMPMGGEIRIRAKQIGDCVLIDVEDTGPGIPPEIYAQLFGPFVTSGKKDGLGLGLALSRRIVRDHGGDMWIEPAAGARFVIRLPLT